mgnify:CR=1 FL=1
MSYAFNPFISNLDYYKDNFTVEYHSANKTLGLGDLKKVHVMNTSLGDRTFTLPRIGSTELVTNGGMETGNPPTGWSRFNATGTLAQDAVTFHGGANSMKITLNGSGGEEACIRDISGLTVGNTYQISAWFYGEDLAAEHFWLGFGSEKTLDYSNGAWVNVMFNNVAVADTLSVYAGVHATNAANAGKIFYVDDVSLKEVSNVGDWIILVKNGAGSLKIWATDPDVILGSSTPGAFIETTEARTFSSLFLVVMDSGLWGTPSFGIWSTH